MTDQQPKCLRAIVTCIYADGSSVVIDMKDPANFSTELDTKLEEERGFFSVALKTVTTFKLSSTIKETPAVISSYPVNEV